MWSIIGMRANHSHKPNWTLAPRKRFASSSRVTALRLEPDLGLEVVLLGGGHSIGLKQYRRLVDGRWRGYGKRLTIPADRFRSVINAMMAALDELVKVGTLEDDVEDDVEEGEAG